MGSNRGNKSICLEFESEAEYEKCIESEDGFRDYLKRMNQEYPELFPKELGEGFNLHGFTKSKKQKFKMRRIKLKDNEVYQIRPSFMALRTFEWNQNRLFAQI